MKIGFVSGLGAASAVIQFFTELSGPLAIFGALFLAWMGIRLLTRSSLQSSSLPAAEISTVAAFSKTLLLTIASPMTILSFEAVFASLSGSFELTSAAAVTMVLGVFSGSALWWLALAGLISLIRHRIKPSGLDRISQTAGALLLCFAGWQLQSSLFQTRAG